MTKMTLATVQNHRRTVLQVAESVQVRVFTTPVRAFSALGITGRKIKITSKNGASRDLVEKAFQCESSRKSVGPIEDQPNDIDYQEKERRAQ